MAVRLQQRGQLADDARRQLGSFQRQPAIELHEAGADKDLGIGLPAAGHPADADKRRPVGGKAPGDGGKNMRRPLEQRRARQAA